MTLTRNCRFGFGMLWSKCQSSKAKAGHRAIRPCQDPCQDLQPGIIPKVMALKGGQLDREIAEMLVHKTLPNCYEIQYTPPLICIYFANKEPHSESSSYFYCKTYFGGLQNIKERGDSQHRTRTFAIEVV